MNGFIMPLPVSVTAAVQRLLPDLPVDQRNLLVALDDRELDRFAKFFTPYIRIACGLDGGNPALLAACGETDPGRAALIIFRAMHRHVIALVAPEDRQRLRDIRRVEVAAKAAGEEERLRAVAEKDAKFTSRTCPKCNQPWPSYRQTCKRCGCKATTA